MNIPTTAVLVVLTCGLLALGCKQKEVSSNTDKATDKNTSQLAQQDKSLEDAVKPAPASPDQATDTTPAASSDASQDTPLYDQLKEKIQGKARLRSGTALRLGGVGPATQAEMDDPKLEHLNPATRRAVIAHRKLQQRVPELTTSKGGQANKGDE